VKRYIGGFLELELFPQPGPGYHATAVGLHNARACVSHIINQTAMRTVWLPYYTCNALLEPFEVSGIPYQFYALNEQLELTELPLLAKGEYLVYVNYFGLKNEYVHRLIANYGDQLLVDNTQAYFDRGYGAGWSFNSARKSFGVPDGGYLYGPAEQLGTAEYYVEHTDYHANYLLDRLRGAQSDAYQGFVAYEKTLHSKPMRISAFSAALLSQIDYPAVTAIRRANYERYHVAMQKFNTLDAAQELGQLPADTVPFCYPLLLANGEAIDRRALFAEDIFVAWLWPDVLTRQPTGYLWERRLTQAMLPLPLDHRYGPAEIDRVISAVQQLAATTSLA
jgi:hypothetical protein